jgi:hypothetical protein
MEAIEKRSTDAIFDLPLPPDPSMTLLTQARNDLLLHIDSLTWDGAGDPDLDKELDKAVQKLLEISVARHIKIGQLSQADADAYDKYSSIISEIYGKAHKSGAPESAPPFAYLYTPDDIAQAAQNFFHHLLTISGLEPHDTHELRGAAITVVADSVVKINRDGRAPTESERREALVKIRQIVDRVAKLVPEAATSPVPKHKPRKPRA